MLTMDVTNLQDSTVMTWKDAKEQMVDELAS